MELVPQVVVYDSTFASWQAFSEGLRVLKATAVDQGALAYVRPPRRFHALAERLVQDMCADDRMVVLSPGVQNPENCNTWTPPEA